MTEMKHATTIAPATTVGAVHLTVADLERSVAWYGETVGLSPLERGDGRAALGAGGLELVVLHEQAGAQPVHGHTGLYHYALLLPARHDLARWLVHAASIQLPLTGLSDHLVSEAIYLRDPDGHGIEIYRDRPRSDWGWDGEHVRMDTLPLDTRDLLSALDGSEAEPYPGLPAGTRMGHVHLHVADIPATEQFYSGVLGFDVVAHFGSQATFMSAGGYHHHFGANVWAGRGASPPPPGSAALRHATVLLPDAGELSRVAAAVADSGQEPEPVDGGVMVRDPSQNRLLLTTAG